MLRPLLILSQSNYLARVVDTNYHTKWQTVQIQISWLLRKPIDLDLHSLQMQAISGSSRSRFNFSGGPSVSFTLCCFVVYSTKRFVVCLSMCHFVLVFFSPFCIAITSLGEERANLSAFRTFVRFVLVWICRFPLPLGVWEGLRFVIVALPGLFSYLFLKL